MQDLQASLWFSEKQKSAKDQRLIIANKYFHSHFVNTVKSCEYNHGVILDEEKCTLVRRTTFSLATVSA